MKTIRYGNCLVKWNKNLFIWQVCYKHEVIIWEFTQKPCLDYIRERRICGELTEDVYRHLPRQGGPDES